MGGRYWVYGGLACLGLVSGELEVLRVARLQLILKLLFFFAEEMKSRLSFDIIFYYNKCISHLFCFSCMVSYMTTEPWQQANLYIRIRKCDTLFSQSKWSSRNCYIHAILLHCYNMLARIQWHTCLAVVTVHTVQTNQSTVRFSSDDYSSKLIC
jgi:hypothetical protein